MGVKLMHRKNNYVGDIQYLFLRKTFKLKRCLPVTGDVMTEIGFHFKLLIRKRIFDECREGQAGECLH